MYSAQVSFYSQSSSYLLVAEKTHQLISCNKKMERAITNLVEEKINEEAKSTLELASRPISTPKKILAYEKALKGIPKALLEKVSISKLCVDAKICKRRVRYCGTRIYGMRCVQAR